MTDPIFGKVKEAGAKAPCFLYFIFWRAFVVINKRGLEPRFSRQRFPLKSN